MTFRLGRDVQAELDAAYDYLAADNPAAARRLLSDIQAAMRYIDRQPRGSPPTDEPGVRAKLVGGQPYKIFYRIDPPEIQIVHVHHTGMQEWSGRRAKV